MIFTLISVACATLLVLYLYLTRNYTHWQKRKIPCPDGAIPGVGHMGQLFFKSSVSDCYDRIYKANTNHSMAGLYNFTSPMLMVLEPELVKTVMQTNFTSFHLNAFKLDPDLDPLLSKSPFFTDGDKWASGRKRLTYAFSGMRLKILLESINQVCEKFEEFVHKKLDKSGEAELELKELFARFTAQIVAAAGFSVDGFCFDDEKKHQSFYAMGKTFLEPTILNNLNSALVFFTPILGKIFGARFLPKKLDKFFRRMIADIMKQRRTNKSSPNDFLRLMADLERTDNKEIDLELITSHATSFFIDGYEVPSTVLSFVGFQLATHPKVQEKLREEVMSVLHKYDGVITYEALNEMTYMDQIINESMRLVPAVGFLGKTCTEEFELKGSDGLVCRVQPGMDILIPVQGLHEDPRYWENPKAFDPERFGPDRKHTIERFAFLPFGEGPRMCVAVRLVQLLMKVCLATFLKKFSLETSSKTQLPLKMVPNLITAPKGGLWSIIRTV